MRYATYCVAALLSEVIDRRSSQCEGMVPLFHMAEVSMCPQNLYIALSLPLFSRIALECQLQDSAMDPGPEWTWCIPLKMGKTTKKSSVLCKDLSSTVNFHLSSTPLGELAMVNNNNIADQAIVCPLKFCKRGSQSN